MKVLLLGPPFMQDRSCIPLYRSLHGHEIRTIGCASLKNDTTPDYTFEPFDTAAEIVERISREWKPDCFLCWFIEYFPPPDKIEQCPIKTVAIVSDWHGLFPQIEHNLARYDVVLTDKAGSSALSLPNARPQYFSSPYCYSSAIHRKLDVEKDLDVIFVGGLSQAIHPQRARYLERVASLSDRYKIEIRYQDFGHEYTRQLNRARIVFNNSVRGEMNLRCFETLACGSLLFLEEENLEVTEWLVDREDVVLYREDNVLDLLCHYLDHPDELTRIAERGYAKAETMSGEARFDQLFDWLERQPMGRRRFSELPEHTQACATVLQYLCGFVDAQQALGGRTVNQSLLQWRDDPDLLTLQAAWMLSCGACMPHDGIALLRNVAEKDPDDAVAWLNLEFIHGECASRDAQAYYLERALKARSYRRGRFLLKRLHDPYFFAWQRDLAMGHERLETLWAMAAARLARIHLEQGRPREAHDLAAMAIGWRRDIGVPYHTLAIANSHLGDRRSAVSMLRFGLPMNPLDWKYRHDLVQLLQATGNTHEARSVARDSATIFSAFPKQPELAKVFRDMLAGMPKGRRSLSLVS